MDSAARVCAIITGSTALLCGLVSLSWWFDAGWTVYSVGAVAPISFLIGFVGFFVMFVMLVRRVGGRKPSIGQSEFLSLVRREAPRRLLVALAIVMASAIIGAVHAQVQTGGWGIYDPYGWHHCHWPLTTNHNSEHMCVSHARYLEVQKATDRIFVAFGLGMLSIDCLAFTILSRTPRPDRRTLLEHARA
jgi:hypothetical protein